MIKDSLNVFKNCSYEEAYSFFLTKIKKSESLQSNSNIFIRTLLSSNNFKQIFPKIYEQKKEKPLFGLSFSVKDVYSVKGQNLTAGLKEPLITKNKNHSEIIASFIDKGASLFGITNLDEFEIDFYGKNSNYGQVINPNYKALICGGSSAGSAASVAANICDFSLGSDSAGSIRIPAACNGIIGYVGSESFITTKNMFKSTKSFSKGGLFVNDLGDLQFLIKDEPDKSINNTILIPNFYKLSKLIYPGVLNNFNSLIIKLSKNFQFKEIDFEFKNIEIEKYRKKIIAFEVSKQIEKFGLFTKSLPNNLKAIYALNKTSSETDIEKAYLELKNYRDQYKDLLNNFFLLTPTLGNIVPESNGRVEDNFNTFLSFTNILNLPAISFPVVEKTLGKLPFSLQLVGKNDSDISLIKLSEKISLNS